MALLDKYVLLFNNGSTVLFRGGINLTKKHTLLELKEAEREARKQLILDAAINLYGQKQISMVGMRDIANEVGISPALIYRHFKDQDELFLEAFIKKSGEMIKNFEEILANQQTITIEVIGNEFVRYMLNNSSFFRMMTYFMLDNKFANEYTERFNLTIRKLLAIFDKGFMHLNQEKDIRLHSHAFFSALNGVMITFYHYPDQSEEKIELHIERLTSLIGQLFANIQK